MELEYFLNTFHLTWSDITAEEAKALMILGEERADFRKEKAEQDTIQRKLRR